MGQKSYIPWLAISVLYLAVAAERVAAAFTHSEGENVLRPDQTVSEMVEEVLARQAEALAEHTGQIHESALRAVLETEAGRQLRALGDGPHGHDRASDWQRSLIWERAKGRLVRLASSDARSRPAKGRGYSWVDDYSERLAGKEARREYYDALDWDLARLEG